MSMNDLVSDMLTRIRNASAIRKQSVVVLNSKMNQGILSIFKEYGYILDFEVIELMNNKKEISIKLSYKDRKPAINEIKRISSSGCRVYYSKKDFKGFYNALGTYVVSTSQGIMSDSKAVELGIGGEVLCGIF